MRLTHREDREDGQGWTWHIRGVGRLSLSIAAWSHGASGAHTRLQYEFRPIGRCTALFSGADFSVPGHKVIDSLEVALMLADFLCLGRGDTDAEYFVKYNAAQREWLDSSEREAAQLAVYELQHPEG